MPPACDSAMREPPLRAPVHDQDAMTGAFDLVGELDERPERRRGLRRTARRRRRARQSEQLVHGVRRRAPRRRRQRHERADRLQEVRLLPLRPAARVVPPRLHHGVGGEAVADDVHAQRPREHALAPLTAEVPVVGDLVVVADHVGRHVRERAPHARQAGAEPARPPLEEFRRPVLAGDPVAALLGRTTPPARVPARPAPANRPPAVALQRLVVGGVRPLDLVA